MMISTEKLRVHPVIESFPRLSSDDFQVLRNSIKAHQILDPLKVTADQSMETAVLVYEGRHRLQIARELGLIEVPIVHEQRSDEEVLLYATESAISRRQINKGQAAYIIFTANKEVISHCPIPKKGRPKVTYRESSHAAEPEAANQTLTALSERYRIDREYFRQLYTMFVRSSDKDWERVYTQLFVEEIGLPRVYAGYHGKAVEFGEAKKTRTAPTYFSNGGLFPSRLKDLGHCLKKFTQLENQEEKSFALRTWQSFASSVPAELRQIAMEAWETEST